MTENVGTTSPEYDNPPVAEVVLGVQFLPVEQLQIPQIIKFAKHVEREFPLVEEAPPLAPVIETYSGVPHDILFPMTPRVWFRSADGGALLQVQRDRFLGNWRKATDRTPYARYKNISREFFGRLDDFTQFLNQESTAKPHYTQFELTYINHVHINEGWSSLDDLSATFKLTRPQTRAFLPMPERIDYRSAYLLPDQTGRLHTRIHNGQKKVDGKAVVLLELTVRGFEQDMNKWFSTAHTWIINAFEDLTTSTAQASLWGKKS